MKYIFIAISVSILILSFTSKKNDVKNLKQAHKVNVNYGDTDVISKRVFVKDIKLNTLRFYSELNSDTTIKDSSKFDNGIFLPKGFCIADYAFGRLNNDTLADLALIITKTDFIYDYRLIVLFKNSDSTYEKSLESSYLVSGNGVEIRIDHHVLSINSDLVSHGETLTKTQIRFLNNIWYCVSESHHSFDNVNGWVNDVDFEKGFYKISHEIYVHDKPFKKEIKGLINKKGFLPISRRLMDTLKYAKYNGKSYGFGSHNLWSEEEIDSLKNKK